MSPPPGDPDSAPKGVDWRPTAPLSVLRLRAEMLAAVRRFFRERGVWEVETPALARATASDPHIESFSLPEVACYLQTSPEHAMKRLLAAGSGSIYQLARAFRKGESGSRHNPEFTLLEWYRVGFDHHRLMVEVAELLSALLGAAGAVEVLTYRDAMVRHAGVDPDGADHGELFRAAVAAGLDPAARLDRDGLLDLLFSLRVQPRLGLEGPCFVHAYPPSQAALARCEDTAEGPRAARFECFLQGVELANGYHELADSAEQRRRMEGDNRRRLAAGQIPLPVDEHLLGALEAGLPDCAGVAVGFDRLVMLKAGVATIDQVLAFPWSRV